MPPAVSGLLEVMLSETSTTSPAALDTAPESFSWLRAASVRLPVVCTELVSESRPATSRTIGRREAGTASTTRSSDSVTAIAYGSAGWVKVEDAVIRRVSIVVRTLTSPPASLARVMPTVSPKIRPV